MATYEPIMSTTLTSNQASVTLSSIPQTYTDLRLVVNFTAAPFADDTTAGLRINNDSANRYQWLSVRGTSTTIARNVSYPLTSPLVISDSPAGVSTTIPQLIVMDFFQYRKAFTSRHGLIAIAAGSETVERTTWFFNPTTVAITSLVLLTNNNNFASGSTFTLYGISAT